MEAVAFDLHSLQVASANIHEAIRAAETRGDVAALLRIHRELETELARIEACEVLAMQAADRVIAQRGK